MRIYLVRHGETDYNKMGYMQGRMENSLNLFGIKQVHLCAQKLAHIPFDAIYTSPQKRTLETAQIFAIKRDNIEMYKHPDLQEVDCGSWQGLSWSQIREKYPDINLTNLSPKKLAQLNGGETSYEVQERAMGFLDWIYNFDYETLLVVTHGGVIKSIVAKILGMDLENRGRFYTHNTGITIIEKLNKQEKWKVVTLNDYSHLDDFVYNKKTLESDQY